MLINPYAFGVAAPLVLAEDTFTDTNGTLITAHVPDVGPGWAATTYGIASATVADIQSNRLRLRANNNAVVVNASEANVSIEADWTPAVGVDNRNGIIFRFVDAFNAFVFICREPNGDMILQETDGAGSGLTTNRDTAAFSWLEGTTYRLKVVTLGTSIKCYVDDVEVMTYSTTVLQSATKHGLVRLTGNDASVLDNFVIHGT